MGADPGIFDWMVQTSVQKGLLNFYCGKLLLTETTTCFSICERERCWRRKYCFVSRGEQIIGVLHFWISLEFSLVAKCNVSSIKKSTSSKVVYDPVSVDVKNFSPKQTSSLKGVGWGDPDPPDPAPGSATELIPFSHTGPAPIDIAKINLFSNSAIEILYR